MLDFSRNIRSVIVLDFVKGYICNYFIMFKGKSLAKLCLRAPNDTFNVFATKHLSMPAVIYLLSTLTMQKTQNSGTSTAAVNFVCFQQFPTSFRRFCPSGYQKWPSNRSNIFSLWLLLREGLT
jgi:hypothetical protein